MVAFIEFIVFVQAIVIITRFTTIGKAFTCVTFEIEQKNINKILLVFKRENVLNYAWLIKS